MNQVPETTPRRVCMVVYADYQSDPRVRREAETLVRHGMSVDVVCLRKAGRARHEVVEGVQTYRLPMAKYRGENAVRYALSYVAFFILSALRLTRLHLRRRYHVIQFHTLPDFIVFAGWIPRLLGAKLVLDMHEITPEFYMTKFGVSDSHCLTRLMRVLEKASVRFADALIVINDPIERLIRSRCRPRAEVVVLMNTVDERRFVRNGEPCNRPDAFCVMYHGTLTQFYGLNVAIRAIGLLKNRIPGVELCIVGDMEAAEGLRRLAMELDVSHAVRFRGPVPIEQIPGLIQEAHLGVLPTLRNIFINLSFSNKLAEYVCMKIPVVATRLASTLEYFPEDAISYFESGNAEALAACIYDLYRDPNRRKAQAEKAYEHYQRIRWPIMERRYVDLIEGLILQR